jgi:site-specific DNA recombinase
VADKPLRCAVYTRKSTEDGLDQKFNSLDAQYEACAAYAVSQRHEGWVLNPERYDDGGFSGGNMDRPGLKRLMADVAASKVDIILLYKIDRLTRSLADFAKIVEVIDKAGASFVSITQSFNTTTSMGRLTLNMLLSFAQFEREVTGERIRDKIAASKRKGLWMGGNVPVGYIVHDRKLVVNEPQAEVVRSIFQRYLEVGSVVELVDVLEREGCRTEVKVSATGQMRGGVPYSRGMLYRLLTNPVYRGMIVHKGQPFAGEHEAIVSLDLWDQVQAALLGRTQGHARRLKAKNPSLLVGLLFDGVGRAMTPNHSLKGKVRYRYYITRPELVEGDEAWRVSAHDLEALVCERLATEFDDVATCSGHLSCADQSAQQTAAMIKTGPSIAKALRKGHASVRLQLLEKLVERVELALDRVAIRTSMTRLLTALGAGAGEQTASDPIELRCGATRVWHGRQLRLVIPGPVDQTGFRHRDPELVRLMREVHQARELVMAHADKSVSAIARHVGRCRVRLDRLTKLMCLAPEIVVALLEGRQPIGLSNTTLLSSNLPLDWAEQRAVLGFA